VLNIFAVVVVAVDVVAVVDHTEDKKELLSSVFRTD
jgi:hypothetical protein